MICAFRVVETEAELNSASWWSEKNIEYELIQFEDKFKFLNEIFCINAKHSFSILGLFIALIGTRLYTVYSG